MIDKQKLREILEGAQKASTAFYKAGCNIDRDVCLYFGMMFGALSVIETKEEELLAGQNVVRALEAEANRTMGDYCHGLKTALAIIEECGNCNSHTCENCAPKIMAAIEICELKPPKPAPPVVRLRGPE